MNKRWLHGLLRDQDDGGGEGGGSEGGDPPEPEAVGDPPVSDNTDRLSAIEQTQAQIVNFLKTFTNPPPSTATPPPAAAPVDNEAMLADFFKNPYPQIGAIVNEGIRRGVAAYANGQRHTMSTLEAVAAREAKESLPDKLRPLFDKYKTETVTAVGAVSPELRTSVEVWRNAFSVVLGRHAEELMGTAPEAKPEKKGKTGGPAPSTPGDTPKGKTKITDDEKMIAAKFGMTEEQYAAGRDKANAGEDFFNGKLTFESTRTKARRATIAV